MSQRRAATVALAVWCAIAGCAAAPGGRAAIEERCDAITAAVRTADVAQVRALWTANPEAAGSPLAALDHAAASGGRVSEWTSTIHRFRTAGDTAVVDASVRSVEEHAGTAIVTSQVVRAFWVRAASGWTVVRTEPLGAADVAPAAR